MPVLRPIRPRQQLLLRLGEIVGRERTKGRERAACEKKINRQGLAFELPRADALTELVGEVIFGQ